MTAISKIVKPLINENAVMVFSKSYCPYCNRAKAALKGINVEFKAIELDKEANGSDIQAYLAELTKQRTVPNIFVKGHHIGGCDDTLAAIKSGKIQQLIKGEHAQL
ncbi:glutaredoxin-1 [Linderina pennispora]|uniref:Glutaredoxin-1 n=1 Tax=Linderina pennispora TaxID=61395 RepID=A0A1Y1WDW2_9FUNG|nr:glutaredoxin-1 [Linderina pennispora]KAJ1938208.1 Glutaredoxin [Linderina pennispora]ORX71518.1 glutaredoxin-1 [Linderina pennispora]